MGLQKSLSSFIPKSCSHQVTLVDGELYFDVLATTKLAV